MQLCLLVNTGTADIVYSGISVIISTSKPFVRVRLLILRSLEVFISTGILILRCEGAVSIAVYTIIIIIMYKYSHIII